jgi:hypothetical protein
MTRARATSLRTSMILACSSNVEYNAADKKFALHTTSCSEPARSNSIKELALCVAVIELNDNKRCMTLIGLCRERAEASSKP